MRSVNYNGYQVFENGTVIGKRFNKALKTGIFGHGYELIIIHCLGKRKTIILHRLIAELFIPNPEKKPCINHKNGIKTDNRVENLEWVTYKENSIHANKNGFARDSGVKVIQLDLENNKIAEFKSMHEAQRITGINDSSICVSVNNDMKIAGGYKWRRKI
jgi:hypothetical protein